MRQFSERKTFSPDAIGTRTIMNKKKEPQLAGAVLMIRPVRFQSNPITAVSNRFQGKTSATPEQQQAAAAAQFESIVAALTAQGVRVIVFDDTTEPHTPDAIFPNNWVSFHADGTVVLYPMLAENRRTERRMDIIDSLADEYDFDVRRIIDLTHHENAGHYLEGTGSMVLDRSNRIAYACLSPRTQLDALGDFAQRMDYEVLAFDAVDRDGAAIYHTNVLMNVGESLAVICDAAIPDPKQRAAVMKSLAATGHQVLSLTMRQLESFAGNMLELRPPSGTPMMAMSGQARRSLDNDQITAIEKHARIVSAPIDDIERSAGGSVRCMLAEIHLPS
jgi:hypothetical protein